MLGGFAVGKTSLVGRFVRQVFDDSYHTTIGVKIDTKQVDIEGRTVKITLWDLAGEDRFRTVQTAYLKGAAGYMLVLDRTRKDTLDVAKRIHDRVQAEVGAMPFVVLANKSDLADQREITDAMLDQLSDAGWEVYATSAKTGDNVETAFVSLARASLS